MNNRKAFTLIELLISIALFSLVMLALYKSLAIQRVANNKVHKFLDRALNSDRMVMVLYNDIIRSNGKITKQKADKGPVCMDETGNSLYGLSMAKVCWMVSKSEDSLLRIEGNNYKLPVDGHSGVEVDLVAKYVDIFSITRKKDKVLVVLKLKGEEPYSFVVEGIEEQTPPPRTPPPRTPPAGTPPAGTPPAPATS